MRVSQIEALTGIPYTDTFDCADFVIHTAKVLFGKTVFLPNGRPRPKESEEQAAAITVAMGELAYKIEDAQDGDIVLMRDAGMKLAGHVGTYFYISHEGWVLHSSHVIGHSRLHRMRDLERMGLHVEGIYRWNL